MTHSITLSHIFNLVRTVCKMRTANSNQHYFLNQLKISANRFEEKVVAVEDRHFRLLDIDR